MCNGKIGVNLEIKGKLNLEIEELLNILSKKFEANDLYTHGFYLSAFDHDILDRMHQINSKVKLSYLQNEWYEDDFEPAAVRPWAYSYSFCVSALQKHHVEYLKGKGIKTAVWYEGGRPDIQRDPLIFSILGHWGVEHFISDYVEMFTQWRDTEY